METKELKSKLNELSKDVDVKVKSEIESFLKELDITLLGLKEGAGQTIDDTEVELSKMAKIANVVWFSRPTWARVAAIFLFGVVTGLALR